jgi:benzoyl-CoA 2,3-dioxygenase component B
LPHEGFNRSIGVFSAVSIDPRGNIISADEWASHASSWLPSTSDAAFIQSLMKPCFEAGQYASWIAPPKVGINNQPGDFEYVQLHMA